jgi:lipoyl(octanoyl) transferase
MKRNCRVFNLIQMGKVVDYVDGWRYQKALMEQIHQAKKAGEEFDEAILVLEHAHVYTLGRGADESNLLDDVVKRYAVRVERGGEVTYHGPGQIVAYPILDLYRHKKDLHWYVHTLEQTVINTLELYKIEGERSSVNTGVWVQKNKICAVGITASRWLTMHGIAINVNCDLDKFRKIVPCGIRDVDRGVTSISKELSETTNMNHVVNTFIAKFCNNFNLEPVWKSEIDIKQVLSKSPELVSQIPKILN